MHTSSTHFTCRTNCRFTQHAIVLALLLSGLSTFTHAHDGRRFEVQVVNNQLVAQGYISATQNNDGGGQTRPYTNAIHDHWKNITSNAAIATLPSFDIFTPGALENYNIDLELLSVQKWAAPTFAPCTNMTIASCANVPAIAAVLTPVTTETLTAERIGTNVVLSSQTLAANNTTRLVSNIPLAGASDLDFDYVIDLNPTSDLYVYEWRLLTDAPGIAPSDSVYAILSPDGATPIERQHHASLFLEEQLSGFQVVPEPAPLSLLFLLGATTLLGSKFRARSRA